MNETLTSIKQAGAYYTPRDLAEILAGWVVETGKERLLEPSVGDGALIRAAISKAKSCMVDGNSLSFVACDKDRTVTKKLDNYLGCQDTVIEGDFLEISAESNMSVDGVIANPPFTRNHDLDPVYRKELRKRFLISGAAGLWVHFLFHACCFLKPGGKLAFLIPASAIFTQYGKVALRRICNDFSHVEIRQITEQPKWSGAADERGAILLARGYKTGSSEMPTVSTWPSVDDWEPWNGKCSCPAFNDIAASTSTLGEIAKVSIGIVTGCNNVFLVSETERKSEGISLDNVLPIAARARHVPGILVDRRELEELGKRGEKTWLLSPQDISERFTGVRRRLAQVTRQQRRTTAWFSKRNPWWAVDEGPCCDAVFTYMNHLGPRLVLAENGIRCTNTLHRVEFGGDVLENKRLSAALSFVSTFGQLAAETIGRQYGGGVLKFELMDTRGLPVLCTPLDIGDELVKRIDCLVRKKKFEEARLAVDEILIAPILGRGWMAGVLEMEADLRNRRLRRYGRLQS